MAPVNAAQGRPKGKEAKSSLKPVAERLSELLGQKVQLAEDCVGDAVAAAVKGLEAGHVLLLENVRCGGRGGGGARVAQAPGWGGSRQAGAASGHGKAASRGAGVPVWAQRHARVVACSAPARRGDLRPLRPGRVGPCAHQNPCLGALHKEHFRAPWAAYTGWL